MTLQLIDEDHASVAEQLFKMAEAMSRQAILVAGSISVLGITDFLNGSLQEWPDACLLLVQGARGRVP